jgi:chorismate mutase
MPSRDHRGVPLRRLAVRRLLPLLAASLVALLLCVAPAAAADRPRMDAAREVLRLTDQRLSLMDQVMVTKWLNRSPIEDRAQEQVVLDGALALTRPRRLGDVGVRRFFTVQITAAKEVQLGWGEEWLMHGFPADTTAPDLTALRAELAELNPRIVDALADVGSLRCQPGAHAALLRASARLIGTRFVTPQRRAQLVDSLLSVRRDGATCRRGAANRSR